MTSNEQALVEAVEKAKRSQFGLTGIKVELEIVFHRELAPSVRYGCDGCVRGMTPCPVRHTEERCGRCQGNSAVLCRHCYDKNTDFSNLKSINDAVLKQLVSLKLAEKIPTAELSEYGYVYRPKGALVFSKVYRDVTVDTEMTFTLSVENAKDILKLPEFLKAFYSLKDKIGQEPNVETAGMHMSLLNAEGACYPSDASGADLRRFANFRKSMVLLMPALFFLGSADERSRRLEYRRPFVDREHTAAINYSHGALEFRVFETCYENPEVILDNVMVMLNCLKFWTSKYTRNYLQKITRECLFGNESSHELKRLYVTSQHIDLLNRGLRMIKPGYRTITELKQQRNFTINKRGIHENAKQALIEAEKQYLEYEKRFGWQQVMYKHNYIADWLHSQLNSGNLPEPGSIPVEAEEYAEERLKARLLDKTGKQQFCQQQVDKLLNSGSYRLCVE